MFSDIKTIGRRVSRESRRKTSPKKSHNYTGHPFYDKILSYALAINEESRSLSEVSVERLMYDTCSAPFVAESGPSLQNLSIVEVVVKHS